MVCCRQRLSIHLIWRFLCEVASRRVGVGGWNIWSGFGSVSVVDTNLVLTGTLGEGPARFLRGSCFSRGFFWG